MLKLGQQISFALIMVLISSSLLIAQEEKKTSKQAKQEKSADKKESTESDDTEQEEEDKPGLRQINLSGNYVDLIQPASFNPTQLLTGSPVSQRSFFKLIKFIDDLSDDDDFDYVLFDLSAPFSMNASQLDQLSRHLNKLSEKKKTYAWMENAGNAALSVAACCDKVVLADFGSIDMPSNSMQSMFFGDALDLFGVQASVVRAGDFKGAVEPFLNSRMSEHLREHNLDMLTSLNDNLVDRIARGRGLKKSEIRELQGQRMLLPQDAKDAGLVDMLAPYGSMQETIEDDIAEEIDWITPKKASKKNASFLQVMTEVMAGSSGSKKFKKNTIAVVHLDGAIVDGKKASPGSIVAGPTVTMIDDLAKQERVKGVVVRINSPGGSATASEAIRQSLLKLAEAKPTVVSMGSVAASGGYWISCIGTPVFAEKGTITGSIGVFGMKMSVGALLRRFGIHMENINLDESAGAMALDRPWSDDEKGEIQRAIDQVYDRFLDLVSDARGIPVDDLHKLAGGRVWSGSQAIDKNLVDHIGGVDDCISLVAKKADLEDGFAVAHRPISKSGLDLSSLLGSGGGEEISSSLPARTLKWLEASGFDLKQTKLILDDSLRNQGRPTTWLLVPYEYSIK